MNELAPFHAFAARLRELIACNACGDETFNALALELFARQSGQNEVYRRYCESLNVPPPTTWQEIPTLPVSAFKDYSVTCLPAYNRTHFFQSSGTTQQQRSKHYHCAESLQLYEIVALSTFEAHLLPARSPMRIAALTPPPNEAPHSSLVHMFETIRRAHSGEPYYFASVTKESAWVLKLQEITSLFRTTNPLLLLGTAFSFVHLLDAIDPIQLPPGSRVMETGGYKGQSREVPRDELHSMIAAKLGITRSDIVTEYGMSELSSQAYATGASPLRFPPWVRTRIISPETGRESDVGILEIFDLANVYSAFALQTQDLARVRKDGFELIGRAPTAELRGCSLMPSAG